MISMIVAHANGLVIGDTNTNSMLWHIKSDLQYFRDVTMGSTIVMGRKTFDSIGKVLEGRKTIVITRDRNFHVEGVQVYHDINDAISELMLRDDEVFIVGGGTIYSEFMKYADKLYITHVLGQYSGDVKFIEYIYDFICVSVGNWLHENSVSFRYTTWERKNKRKQ